MVQERHAPLEIELIQGELGSYLENLAQVQSRIELLANLIELAVDADLGIELLLELIEFVLGPDEAFDLLGQTAVFVLQDYQPLF
jgi:hypothetical protein